MIRVRNGCISVETWTMGLSLQSYVKQHNFEKRSCSILFFLKKRRLYKVISSVKKVTKCERVIAICASIPTNYAADFANEQFKMSMFCKLLFFASCLPNLWFIGMLFIFEISQSRYFFKYQYAFTLLIQILFKAMLEK